LQAQQSSTNDFLPMTVYLRESIFTFQKLKEMIFWMNSNLDLELVSVQRPQLWLIHW